ncbi:MAG: hypothetical protein AAB407_04195, partial [Patescibacteria group bacterium]
MSSISKNGRYVAFSSNAFNLVPNDTNGWDDIFVHDRQIGATKRVSVSSNGIQGNFFSDHPSISADGRYVAFWSFSSNLVSNDTNGQADIFVNDSQTGMTVRVSISSNGTQGNGSSFGHSISADGRYVAFSSNAFNLVPNDTNGASDIFAHDRQTNMTSRLSIDSSGNQANNVSGSPSISADGRYVTFHSVASNLVTNDTNGVSDVFVHSRYQLSGTVLFEDGLTPVPDV